MSGSFLGRVWRVSGGFLESLQRVPGVLGDVWKAFRECLEDVWRVSAGCQDIVTILTQVNHAIKAQTSLVSLLAITLTVILHHMHTLVEKIDMPTWSKEYLKDHGDILLMCRSDRCMKLQRADDKFTLRQALEDLGCGRCFLMRHLILAEQEPSPMSYHALTHLCRYCEKVRVRRLKADALPSSGDIFDAEESKVKHKDFGPTLIALEISPDIHWALGYSKVNRWRLRYIINGQMINIDRSMSVDQWQAAREVRQARSMQPGDYFFDHHINRSRPLKGPELTEGFSKMDWEAWTRELVHGSAQTYGKVQTYDRSNRAAPYLDGTLMPQHMDTFVDKLGMVTLSKTELEKHGNMGIICRLERCQELQLIRQFNLRQKLEDLDKVTLHQMLEDLGKFTLRQALDNLGCGVCYSMRHLILADNPSQENYKTLMHLCRYCENVRAKMMSADATASSGDIFDAADMKVKRVDYDPALFLVKISPDIHPALGHIING